jgi:hypothetical protein
LVDGVYPSLIVCDDCIKKHKDLIIEFVDLEQFELYKKSADLGA